MTVFLPKTHSKAEKIVDIGDENLTDEEIDEIAEQELFSIISWDWERL